MFTSIQRNPICYLALRMWEFGAGRRKAIVFTMVGSMMGMMMWLMIPLVMARFINRAQDAAGNGALVECAWLLALTVVFGLLGWVFHGPSRVTEMVTSVFVRRNLQLGLLTKVTRLPMRWHTEHHSGETIDRVAQAGSALADFADASFVIVHLFGRLLGAMVMMSLFMPEAALIVTIATVLAFVLIMAFDRLIVPVEAKGNRVLNRVASKVQDYLTNITTVISLRLEDRVIKEVDQQLAQYAPLKSRTALLHETKWFLSGSIVDTTRAVTLFWFVMKAVQDGRVVELGTLVALNEYLSTLAVSFAEFTWRWGDFVVKATRLRAIEEMEHDYTALVGEVSSTRLPAGWRELSLAGVSFQHATNSQESAGVFDIDLTLERGKSYAIVGTSGSGKSTLLSLLRGLNRARTGAVYCDGIIVEDGLGAVSHHTTLIPQDPEVFADSVLKNITMGIEAPTEKVLQAIEMAKFAQVLAQLPKGLETNIAEKGVSLSGGQKQRLALARGIFFAFDSDSEILLLDESTSSVDVANEQEIYETLLKHFRSELIVATTHKFNLLPLFDEVIVMQAGRIVEKGTLAELVAADGILAPLWRQYSDATSPLRLVHA
jgi:ATP-binding cassette subfamily B protein